MSQKPEINPLSKPVLEVPPEYQDIHKMIKSIVDSGVPNMEGRFELLGRSIYRQVAHLDNDKQTQTWNFVRQALDDSLGVKEMFLKKQEIIMNVAKGAVDALDNKEDRSSVVDGISGYSTLSSYKADQAARPKM